MLSSGQIVPLMFKEKFKYYKSKCPSPTFDEVIDLSQTIKDVDQVLKHKAVNTSLPDEKFTNLGLKGIENWDIYHILDRPGLIYVRNPFTNIGQRYWIRRCLVDFSHKPNKLNLDAIGELGPSEDWWPTCMNDKARKSNLLKKLRWATLGYHHDWNTKVYNENMKGDFPTDLAGLSNVVASVACNWPNFIAQAAIINFYHMDSTLSGHKDYSEMNMDAPLLSFSFGQSAIFLVGGETLEEKPTALLLHSGDIVIMFAQARLAYHGVPRIVPAPSYPWLITQCVNDRQADVPESNLSFDQSELVDIKAWEPFNSYLKSSRINMNVRQVLLPDQKEIKS